MVIALDVYGTLIDPSGVVRHLQALIGPQAADFSRLWRGKQLEYSFRRGLMQNYRDFSVCTSQALDYCCKWFNCDLSLDDRAGLLASYRQLPAFPDALSGVKSLSEANLRLYAFSNGLPNDVISLLQTTGLDAYLLSVVSTDELKSFKPNPGVYAHFLRRAGCLAEEAWLVSGNPFDVIGAISAGLRGAWVQRSETDVFDPWEIEPTLVVNDLDELATHLLS